MKTQGSRGSSSMALEGVVSPQMRSQMRISQALPRPLRERLGFHEVGWKKFPLRAGKKPLGQGGQGKHYMLLRLPGEQPEGSQCRRP